MIKRVKIIAICLLFIILLMVILLNNVKVEQYTIILGKFDKQINLFVINFYTINSTFNEFGIGKEVNINLLNDESNIIRGKFTGYQQTEIMLIEGRIYKGTIIINNNQGINLENLLNDDYIQLRLNSNNKVSILELIVKYIFSK